MKRKLSEEHKRKIGEANKKLFKIGLKSNKGKNNPMYGRHYPQCGFQKGHPDFAKNKGRKHSKESKKRMSEAHKGKKLSEETKKKIGNAQKGHPDYNPKRKGCFQKGHKVPLEWRKITSEYLKEHPEHSFFKKGHKRFRTKESYQNSEYKKKISIANKGKKRTKGQREKLSKSYKYHIPWNKGKKCPEISERQLGEKNHSWEGGISFEPYSLDWNEHLRESIRQRDKYICQNCGIKQNELKGLHKKLAVHHIDYNKKNCNPKNLITLCISCNNKANFDRDYWKKYFQISISCNNKANFDRDYWKKYFQIKVGNGLDSPIYK